MPKKKQRTLLIAGYYGFGNTGDEAILSSILAELCKEEKDLDFIVVSANPSETAALFNVRTVFWKDVDALLQAAEESDLILLGGGGLFQDYWGVPKGIALTPFHWGISFYSAIGMMAVLYQKPFMIYSVGVGPLVSEEGKRQTRQTFDLASIATVRDTESRDLLVSLGIPEEKIRVAPDPAITIQADAEPAEKILQAQGIDLTARPLVGVCIRNWQEGEQADRWKKELAASLDQFFELHDAQVVFIPFQVRDHPLENDHVAALSVLDRMNNKDRVYALPHAYPLAIVAGLISHCRLVVGMRLHSLIFAAGAAVPSVALAYDPKIHNFMGSLTLSEYSFPLASMTSDQLARSLTIVWVQHESIHEILRIQAEKLRDLSSQAPRLAIQLLEHRVPIQASLEMIRSLVIQQARDLAERESEVQALSSRLWTVSAQLLETEHQLQITKSQLQLAKSQLDEKQHELNEILVSKSWKLAQQFRNTRIALIPLGSRREKLARAVYSRYKSLYHMFSKAILLIRHSIRQHGLPLAFLKGIRILGIRLYHANKKILHRNKYNRELKQLDALIHQHAGFFDIFHVPMGWKTVLFQRFQHLSLQTARLGGLALYGGHPIVDREITVYQEAAENLYVFDATNRQVVDRMFKALEKKQQPRILRVQSIDLVTTEEDIHQFIHHGFTVVYEYIDEINPAITGNVPDLVYQRHKAILEDERVLVVATSDQLFEDVQRFRSNNFILSTNGVDLDHWRIAKGEPPSDLKPALKGNLVVGYHGAMAKWMDYDQLRLIADEGSYELVLIGHEHDSAFAESGLKNHPRVHFLGAKPYAELNRYAAHYDIAILPFLKTELTQAVSPVKVFEYMAARKPIVTTDLRECKKYRSCLIAGTHNEFMEQLVWAAEHRDDPEYLGILDAEASDNSWEKKTVEILRLAGVKI